MSLPRSPRLASAPSSCLVVIDMQERLLPVIDAAVRVTQRCRFLMEAAGLLSVPIVITEQYPRGLGTTIEPLRDVAANAVVLEKLRFSGADALQNAGVLRPGLRQLVLAGIETHICVQQTALDLVAAGWDVILAADASGSRQEVDRSAALVRLAAAGVTVSTAESVVFEWCETAEHPNFRQLSALVRAQASRGV